MKINYMDSSEDTQSQPTNLTQSILKSDLPVNTENARFVRLPELENII